MKHLIHDTKLQAYLEGRMSPQEERNLISKLKDNGEMETLYHLREAWLDAMQDFADTWLGKDATQQPSQVQLHLAAKDKIF